MQDRRPPQGVFVGRAAEVAHVTDVIARVATGQPWLVAIEGDPGVGKTALARCCLAGAEGVSLPVLLARADQAEADLDFGLVDQLLRAAGEVSQLIMPAGGTGSAIRPCKQVIPSLVAVCPQGRNYVRRRRTAWSSPSSRWVSIRQPVPSTSAPIWPDGILY